MTIKPLFDRVLLKPIGKEETTAGGIILPSKAEIATEICEVIEVGPGGKIGKDEVTMVVEKGQKVLIRDYSGTDFKTAVGEHFKVVMQSDIIAIIEE